MTKSEIRRIFTEKRNNLSADEKKRAEAKITKYLLTHFVWSDFRQISIFLSIRSKNEFETEFFIRRVREKFPHLKIYAPRVNFTHNQIENIELDEYTKIIVNKWQIPEPRGSQIIEPKELGAIVTPLLAFDRNGFRVGYGGGFYDRLFAVCRPNVVKIGVSFFPPVNEIADCSPHDIPLDFCVTPHDLYSFRR